jgi:hypothetical protein
MALTIAVVPLEAVSGTLQTNGQWEREITAFWSACAAVFHSPDRSTRAGTHIHITPGPEKRWSIDQLRRIAVGIVSYEDLVQEMLPAYRRTGVSSSDPSRIIPPTSYTGHQFERHYCESNSRSSRSLYARFHGGPDPQSRTNKLEDLKNSFQSMSERDIVHNMQGDRYVLWNFDNILKDKKTIEFRGGRGVRGPNRTRWWIAFVVGFIHCLLTEVWHSFGVLERMLTRLQTDRLPIERTPENVDRLFNRIKQCANSCGIPYLPESYRVLNETPR